MDGFRRHPRPLDGRTNAFKRSEVAYDDPKSGVEPTVGRVTRSRRDGRQEGPWSHGVAVRRERERRMPKRSVELLFSVERNGRSHVHSDQRAFKPLGPCRLARVDTDRGYTLLRQKRSSARSAVLNAR